MHQNTFRHSYALRNTSSPWHTDHEKKKYPFNTPAVVNSTRISGMAIDMTCQFASLVELQYHQTSTTSSSQQRQTSRDHTTSQMHITHAVQPLWPPLAKRSVSWTRSTCISAREDVLPPAACQSWTL